MFFETKNITREQLAELLQYGQSPECQFPILITSEGSYLGRVEMGSVIRFPLIKEHIANFCNDEGLMSLSLRFEVRIFIEDNYWVKVSEKTGELNRVGTVPLKIQEKVKNILRDIQ